MGDTSVDGHGRAADVHAVTFIGVDRLERLMRQHIQSPFPEAVEKGTEYGGVDCVMVGPDVYGWATLVVGGADLPLSQQKMLEVLVGELRDALPLVPAEARLYYERVAELADEVLRRCA